MARPASDVGKIELGSLSNAELKRLAANLRARGRHDLARRIQQELDFRAGRSRPRPPETPPPRRHSRGRWRAVAAGVAAALLAGGATLLVEVLTNDRSEPSDAPVQVATAEPRAMSLVPAAPPVAETPEPAQASAPSPSPEQHARKSPPSSRPTLAPPRVLAEAPLQRVPPEAPIARPAAVAAAPEAEVAGAVVLASAQSTAALAADCASAGGAERLVCEDARRAALNPRTARGAPIPVRVAVMPGARPAAPLAAPR